MKFPKISRRWLLFVLIPLMGQGCWGCWGCPRPLPLPPTDGVDLTQSMFSVNPLQIRLNHPAGFASCPDLFPKINLDGPPGGSWSINNLADKPAWINFDKESGTFPDMIQPSFPCSGYSAEQNWTLQLSDGTTFLDIPVDLLVDF